MLDFFLYYGYTSFVSSVAQPKSYCRNASRAYFRLLLRNCYALWGQPKIELLSVISWNVVTLLVWSFLGVRIFAADIDRMLSLLCYSASISILNIWMVRYTGCQISIHIFGVSLAWCYRCSCAKVSTLFCSYSTFRRFVLCRILASFILQL